MELINFISQPVKVHLTDGVYHGVIGTATETTARLRNVFRLEETPRAQGDKIIRTTDPDFIRVEPAP